MENIEYILPQHYAEVVLRLSKEITQYAQQHEWDLAREIEIKRNNVLQELFSHPDIDEELPNITATLLEVMELDAEVIIHGEFELQEMATKIYGINKGKRVVNAYLKS